MTPEGEKDRGCCCFSLEETPLLLPNETFQAIRVRCAFKSEGLLLSELWDPVSVIQLRVELDRTMNTRSEALSLKRGFFSLPAVYLLAKTFLNALAAGEPPFIWQLIAGGKYSLYLPVYRALKKLCVYEEMMSKDRTNISLNVGFDRGITQVSALSGTASFGSMEGRTSFSTWGSFL